MVLSEDKYTQVLNLMVINDSLFDTLLYRAKEGLVYSDTVDTINTNWRMIQDILEDDND